MSPKVALLCSGLGNVHRGHEVFARDLFDLVSDSVDITLFKGGGTSSAREVVIDHVARNHPGLSSMHLAVSEKWRHAAEEVERLRVEGETFAYGALRPLLEGGFNVIHCLEQEVTQVLYSHRHLFASPPKILWSNGGALRARQMPPCDFVQEHTEYNLTTSAQSKAFVIPHGVNTRRFHPKVESFFRKRHGIPDAAFVVISVGTICYWHKRMDHVIREVAQVPEAWLVIVGQESHDSTAIKALGQKLMGGRIVFATMPHDELPQAYAAADVFVLGSLFETFGIVYIEAMAMGLPVICCNHPNQQSIVKQGIFIDMAAPGALATALTETPTSRFRELGQLGVEIVRTHYDLESLKKQYVLRYNEICNKTLDLPKYDLRTKILTHTMKALDAVRRLATK